MNFHWSGLSTSSVQFYIEEDHVSHKLRIFGPVFKISDQIQVQSKFVLGLRNASKGVASAHYYRDRKTAMSKTVKLEKAKNALIPMLDRTN